MAMLYLQPISSCQWLSAGLLTPFLSQGRLSQQSSVKELYSIILDVLRFVCKAVPFAASVGSYDAVHEKLLAFTRILKDCRAKSFKWIVTDLSKCFDLVNREEVMTLIDKYTQGSEEYVQYK
eukprot:Gregarina_sp_Poly_1__6178@NODE_326_length_9503_cov_249_815388_g278_i0_p8_GENE_NODE_326_length_9503_cov_249_815388_g278_i0NODE_326_length_9503_cov_249_815388_g278_i0_p8_ORF_typecomplete_len122_score11_36RVT_1/PF00078_27/0_13_NODE_326_length_9503_cov_249_815388_g278_i037274092